MSSDIEVSRNQKISDYSESWDFEIPSQKPEWKFLSVKLVYRSKPSDLDLDERNWACKYGENVFESGEDSILKALFGILRISGFWPKARKNIFLHLIFLHKFKVSTRELLEKISL